MDFITVLKTILFGIIEGITEWLPISSTGHLIIAEQYFGFASTYGVDFWNLFLVVIQFGAILAVIISFFHKIWPFGKKKSAEEKKQTWLLIFNVVIACLPGVIAGIIGDDYIDSVLHGALVVAITLIVYGIIFIVIEIYSKKSGKNSTINDLKDITWKTAVIIGFAQILSMIPGTSRSGITIIAALILGFSRSTAAEFSFIVSIPMIIGASGYKTAKYFINGGNLSSVELGIIVIGIVVAFIVSLLTIKFFMKFIKSKTFTGFGIYRIALGIVLIVLFSVGAMNATPQTSTLLTIETIIKQI